MKGNLFSTNDFDYKSINVLQEIKNYTIDIEAIPFVLDFTLLWSLFEASLVKNNESLNFQSLYSKLVSIKPNEIKNPDTINSNFEKILLFEKGEDSEGILTIEGLTSYRINLRFDHDKNSNKKNIQNLENIFSFFEKEQPSFNEKLICLGMIAYRIRNNLFHGQKDLNYLWEQSLLFKIVVDTLAELVIIFNKKI